MRRMGSAQDARAVVDWIASVDATQPAALPGGGDVPGRIGAAYAPSKGVAKKVIATLAL